MLQAATGFQALLLVSFKGSSVKATERIAQIPVSDAGVINALAKQVQFPLLNLGELNLPDPLSSPTWYMYEFMLSVSVGGIV